MVTVHRHAQFEAIPYMGSTWNVRKPQIWPVSLIHTGTKRRKINVRNPQIWPVSLSHIGTKRRKINKQGPEPIPFWRWPGYISLQNFRLILDTTLVRWADVCTDIYCTVEDERMDRPEKQSRTIRWMNRPNYMYVSKHAILGLRRLDNPKT